VQLATDVFRYNYRLETYAGFRAANPTIPLYGSEPASTISTRGECFFPVSEERTDPAARERMAKELAARGRIEVPSRSSYFGIVDLAGLPKDRFYLYQARWQPDHPMAHILPHWTWSASADSSGATVPRREGEVTPVYVYTSGDEAELFLNGRSLGRKKRGPGDYRLRWDDVRYAPGEVKVVAYKNGRHWAEAVQRTAGASAKIALTPDRTIFHVDGSDLVFVTVDITDDAGVLAPHADNLVRFSLQGPADIIATDNGNPISFESFQAPERKAFNGRAVVMVRSRAGREGSPALHAESEGLAATEVTLKSVAQP
jgi:beta-galactosidase